MAIIVDVVALFLGLAISYLIYRLYYKLFVTNYIKRIKTAMQKGEVEKAMQMREIALERQSKRMQRLFLKHGIFEEMKVL